MMGSMAPLMIRMALLHAVLVYGTNNDPEKTTGMSSSEISNREIGSRLVLGARIFYAVLYDLFHSSPIRQKQAGKEERKLTSPSIWMAKFTICEFLRRVACMIWSRSLQTFLRCLYFFLASTLTGVLIATLAECQPFNHYWQVRPDPGAHCRLGYAHLITMGTCDIITDLLLVAYPIPVILRSLLPTKRKASLVPLFALSLILVAITAFRVPTVIQQNGSQPYRSLLASLEILAATAISNAVVIASFVRDKGAKRPKFERDEGHADVNQGMMYSSSRRATITRFQWGSDSDLAGDLGIRLDPALCSSSIGGGAEAMADTAHLESGLSNVARIPTAQTGVFDPNWSFERAGISSPVTVAAAAAVTGGGCSYDDSAGISPTHTRKNSVAPLMPLVSDSPVLHAPPRSASLSSRRSSVLDIDRLLRYLQFLERRRRSVSHRPDQV